MFNNKKLRLLMSVSISNITAKPPELKQRRQSCQGHTR